jgi:hypothetical protein
MALAVVSVLLAAPRLGAQELGRAGSLAIGAERLTGVATTHSEATVGSGAASAELERDTFSVALFANDPATPFVTPRIGVDYFVIDRLSAGGFLAYASHSTDSSIGSAKREDSAHAIALGVRGGYAVPFTDLLGIWPRAGVSYVTGEIEQGDDETETWILALSAEVMLFITPAAHVAFVVGPTADVTVAGAGQSENAAGNESEIEDLRVQSFGLQAGVVVWF